MQPKWIQMAIFLWGTWWFIPGFRNTFRFQTHPILPNSSFRFCLWGWILTAEVASSRCSLEAVVSTSVKSLPGRSGDALRQTESFQVRVEFKRNLTINSTKKKHNMQEKKHAKFLTRHWQRDRYWYDYAHRAHLPLIAAIRLSVCPSARPSILLFILSCLTMYPST